MRMVASALMSGLTPRRTFENTTIGSVLEPGPATKLAITRSSRESVKASSQPDSSAGKMIGSVTRKNTFAGRAPRSCAASSSDSSNCARRDCTTTVTNAIAKVMWAMMMVVMPRPCGHPTSCSSVTNSSSSDRPVITSGITSGAVAMPDSSVRPRNGPKRASAMPVSVPSTTAAVAAIAAILRLSSAAPTICLLASRAPYHLVENPPHTVTSRDSLNEKTTSETMGMYRNAKPSTRARVRNQERPPLIVVPPRSRRPGHAGRT